ncbi:hypothetical protein Tco_0693774 [Tanacetum coccineum]
MVTVPIHQETSSVPPMTTLVIDLTIPQPNSPNVHAPLLTSTATTTIITKTTLPPPPLQLQQSTTDLILLQCIGELEQHMENLIQDNSALAERLNKHRSRLLYNLEKLDIPHKVSQAVDEIVTDAVDWAMQAPLRARFRDLPTKSLELDYSNQHLANQEEARKKRRKRRDVPRSPSGSPPHTTSLPHTSKRIWCSRYVRSIEGHGVLSSSKTTVSAQQSMAWTTFDTRYESTGILLKRPRKDWEEALPEEENTATPELSWTILPSNVSDVENNWASALASSYKPPVEKLLAAKTSDMTTFLNWYCHQINKSKLTQADLEGQAYEVVKVDWANPEGDQVRINVNRPLPLGGPPGHVTIQTEFFFNKDLEYLRFGNKGSMPVLSISKMKAARYPDFGLELLVPEQMWIEDVCTYDISVKYGIAHWWFNRQKFYIDRHESPSRRKEVRTHMRILSVVRIKAYSRYGYDYLSEIVLRRADFQEHTIAEKDFKNLYPSDFEDLNLLLLAKVVSIIFLVQTKWMLSTAVKLWTRNLVIRQRVEDFQLGIESYQTQLNLTKPGWDATGYEFKHDYTIIESPRAAIFLFNNNEQKIMRFNKIYKFSDGMLTRILETLDYRVKEFKIKRLNPGMNTRFWTEKDVIRSKEFITAIERRLKTRRIYQNLECFVGGRVRDIDSRLLQRTE